jgi:hypothetical protein
LAIMASWTRVKWTEASQVADLLAWPDDLGEHARMAPEAYFAKLRGDGRLNDAVFFLGQALPRYETVTWAARVVRDLRQPILKPGPEANALRATLLWVQDPSDTRRRTAFEAADKVRNAGPERLVALAAYFSGGSITPVDAPPVQAPREAAGRFAAGAALLAAISAPDRDAALSEVLDKGAAMASGGVDLASA